MSEEIKNKIKEDEAHLPESTSIRKLTPDNTRFIETVGKMLNAEVENYVFERVQVHSSFPHSDPEHYISIRTRENKEVGLIEDINLFSEEQKDLLKKQMRIRYFSPIITKIINVKDEFGYIHFYVDTDCGECRFTVRAGGGSVIHPTANKYIITDVDGNRFIIPDVTLLPVKEYKMIDIYL